jgi:hypothetical protein
MYTICNIVVLEGLVQITAVIWFYPQHLHTHRNSHISDYQIVGCKHIRWQSRIFFFKRDLRHSSLAGTLRIPNWRKFHFGATRFLLDSWTPRMGPIGCTETLVTHYHYLLRNNTEQRSSQLLCSGILNSCNSYPNSFVHHLLPFLRRGTRVLWITNNTVGISLLSYRKYFFPYACFLDFWYTNATSFTFRRVHIFKILTILTPDFSGALKLSTAVIYSWNTLLLEKRNEKKTAFSLHNRIKGN